MARTIATRLEFAMILGIAIMRATDTRTVYICTETLLVNSGRLVAKGIYVTQILKIWGHV